MEKNSEEQQEQQQQQQQFKRKSPEFEEETLEQLNNEMETEPEHQERKIKEYQTPAEEITQPKPELDQTIEKLPPYKKSKTRSTKPIVELEINKPTLVMRQKPIELVEVSNQTKKTLVAVTEELESSDGLIQQLSPSQINLVACLVHESDKTLPELSSYVHSKLLPQAKLLIEDEPSQEPFDPLPLSVIEATINQVARRVNYAPVQADLDWLPQNLPKAFQIWRWESNNHESVIPSDLKEISQKRWAERQLIKPQICALLSGLDSSERDALLKKLNPGKRKTAKNDINATNTKPMPTSKSLQAKGSPEIVCMGSSPTTPKPQKTDHQTTGNKILSEKEIIKQQKDQKRKDKEDARLAEERQKKKMGSLMSGWMTKASTTPRTTTMKRNSLNISSQSDEVQFIAQFKSGIKVDSSINTLSSDFDKTFKPFHLKPHSQLAPINRLRSNNQSPSDSDQPQPFASLTHQECLDQFLKLMRSQKKKCDSPDSSKTSNSTNNKGIKTVREIVAGIGESELTGCIDGSKKWRRALQNRSIIPIKFLRFHEDVRPGYIGTWCKTSRLVTGRNPFGKDTCLLDYDYDSEADWNEEDGEGEDLEQSDGGKEDGGEGMSSELADSDEDGWLVGDDDEIEMVDDGQIHASNRTLDSTLDDDLQLVPTNKKIAGLARRKIVRPLIPVIKGPIWEEALGVVSNNMFEPFRIQMINDAPLGLNPFEYEPKTVVKANRPQLFTSKPSPAILPLPESASQLKNGLMDSTIQTTKTIMTKSNKDNLKENEEKRAANHSIDKLDSNPPNTSSSLINFPQELMPEMIRFVNGNKKSKPILLEDLKNLFFDKFNVKVSKRSIEKVLNLSAVKVSGTWRIVDASSSPTS